LILEQLESRWCPTLTLTQAGINQGFSLSTFATNFPNDGSVGPLGIGFPVSGGVVVGDRLNNVRLFPTDSDGQSAATVAPTATYNAPHGFARVNGKMYLALAGAGEVIQVNDDGTFNHIVVSGLTEAAGLVADPADGHLFVSTVHQDNIWDVDPIAQTATLFVNTGKPDGITITADASILYAAQQEQFSSVIGFYTSTGAIAFGPISVPGNPDGVALGTGALAGNLFVNNNNGTVVEINLTTLTQTVIASNGSRGDFVTVDPNNNDNSLLLTQTDSIARLTAPINGGFVNPNRFSHPRYLRRLPRVPPQGLPTRSAWERLLIRAPVRGQ
jgi:hypothetical protein